MQRIRREGYVSTMVKGRHAERCMPAPGCATRVLSCVATSRPTRTHLTDGLAQEMHCWLTAHLKTKTNSSF